MTLFGGNDQSLNITIKAKDEATAALSRLRLSVGDLAKGFALGEFAVRGVTSAFHFLEGVATDSLKEFEQLNQATAQTNAVLASTQHAAGLTSDEVIKLSKSLSENTLYQDDAVLSAENLLLTFTNISKDTFPRATQTVIDMSTALGQDLTSSAEQVGKALNSPIDGLAMLSRVGVQFTGSQTDMITALVKSGQTMQAQSVILDELNKRFAGSAQSAYESASSTTRLEKNIKDLEQGIGAGLTPALNNLFTAFADVTHGMGDDVDVGLLVFKAFRNITEAAVALGNVFVQTGLGLSAFKTEAKSFFDSISLFSKDEKQKRLQDDQDVLASIGQLSTKSSDFLDKLVSSDEDVIASWGKSTESAKALAVAGPAAYEATAAEAKAASDQIKKTQQAIADTKKTLDDYRKDLTGETSNIADLFVEQEQKVSDLKKQLDEARNATGTSFDLAHVQDLQAQFDKESQALDRAKASGAENLLPDQFANARRRANETDFERNLEDVFVRVNDKGQAFKQDITYTINFNDAVAGDDGIKKIIAAAIAAINRQATLSGLAGQ